PTLARSIENAARDLRLACAQVERMPGQKSAFDALPEPDEFEDAVSAACRAVRNVGLIVAAVRERHPDLDLVARRAPELFTRLQRWLPGADAEPTQSDGEPAESAWPEPPAPAVQGELSALEKADTTSAPDADGTSDSVASRTGRASAPDTPWIRWV